jgi:cyclic pyranopterin phosphate synthase
MRDGSLGSAVFPFEKVSSDLAELPLAARRALDHAGLRLSIEAWRSLPIDHRRQLALSGAEAVVDTGTVIVAVRRARPAPQPIERVADPDPNTPPVGIARLLRGSRTLDARTWARLRPLDRYALAHAHRRSVARNDTTLLDEAFDAIVPRAASVPPARVSARPSDAEPERNDARRGPLATTDAAVDVSTQAVIELESALGEVVRDGSPGSYFHSSRPPPPREPSDALPIEALRVASSSTPGQSAAPGPARSSAPSPEPPVSTHLSAAGEVHMVDIAGKEVTARRAVASGSVRMARETIQRLIRNDTPKGEVLATARVAGIMAAKRTHELVPLCHPLPLTNVAVHLDIDAPALRVNVTAVTETLARTGVEMEALTAVSVACLTLYDMLKGIDREMVIGDLKLLEKSGGRTGHYRREGT